MENKYFFYFFLSVFSFVSSPVFADEFTSSSYRVLDPVIQSAEFSTSAGFQLWSTLGEIGLGTSSITSFQLGAGFLHFPFASTPSVSTTAGDAQVALSWTASTGYLGWTASGYNVGQGTVAGGPYTYTSLGNVLSSTRTGLSNSTTYYFVIIVEDAFGNSIATSTEVSSTPTAPASTPSSGSGSGGGGGGGGGGGIIPSIAETAVMFSGRAYPLSKVSFLKDGQLALTTIAGPDSNFSATVNNLSVGNYTFAVYGEDKNGLRSAPFTFPIYITAGVATNVGGIFIAPTLSVDKSEVKQGDNIAIFGQSASASDIVISINSEQEFFIQKKSDENGIYLLNFDTAKLEKGQHSTKSKSAIAGEISSFSKTVEFIVGTKNVLVTPTEKVIKCDLNEDGRCNLIDFSIAAFWYKRKLSPEFIVREKKHLNGDEKVDLVDFSIMAYYWTG